GLAGVGWVRQAGVPAGRATTLSTLRGLTFAGDGIVGVLPALVWGGGSVRGGGGTPAVNQKGLLARQGLPFGERPSRVGLRVDAAGVEIVAQVGVCLPGGQHTPDDLDEGVGDGERGLLRRAGVLLAAEAAVQPVETRSDAGAGA